MSIVKNNGSITVEYSIPKDIEEHIPEYFYIALLGEWVSIFGVDRILCVVDDKKLGGCCDFDSGTGGWFEAFKATCIKLDMQWLLDYYNTLEWYDSDIFDGIIESRMTEFLEIEDNYCNAYYRYLCQK